MNMPYMPSQIASHGSILKPQPFIVRDCALIALATGRRAQNLKELRNHLLEVKAESLYTHFWGYMLQPGFEERDYNNDFAEWVRHQLHDCILAEQLAVIDPSEYENLEELRWEVIETIEHRLDELEVLNWSPPDRQFHFLYSKLVIFHTNRVLQHPSELPDAISDMSSGSIFYHVIDAARRLPQGGDDFKAWLQQWGQQYQHVQSRLEQVDPYFTSLTHLRHSLEIIIRHALPLNGRS